MYHIYYFINILLLYQTYSPSTRVKLMIFYCCTYCVGWFWGFEVELLGELLSQSFSFVCSLSVILLLSSISFPLYARLPLEWFRCVDRFMLVYSSVAWFLTFTYTRTADHWHWQGVGVGLPIRSPSVWDSPLNTSIHMQHSAWTLFKHTIYIYIYIMLGSYSFFFEV